MCQCGSSHDSNISSLSLSVLSLGNRRTGSSKLWCPTGTTADSPSYSVEAGGRDVTHLKPISSFLKEGCAAPVGSSVRAYRRSSSLRTRCVSGKKENRTAEHAGTKTPRRAGPWSEHPCHPHLIPAATCSPDFQKHLSAGQISTRYNPAL